MKNKNLSWGRWCTLIFVTSMPFLSLGKTHQVFSVSPKSLQNAINKSNRGDTLLVQRGVYKEHDILINRKLTVIGIGFPVLDGENKNQLIVISADSVTIIGIQLQNTGRSSMTDMAGIRVQNASGAIISGNRLLNNTYGIYMQNASNCELKGNTIEATAKDELNSGNGIHAWKSHDLLIRNNKISGHRDGIYFEFVTQSHIMNNLSNKNIRYGLHFMFSHNDTYSGNQFIDNGSGVAVMYSKGVIMLNNTFRHNWGDAAYAILLKEISDSRIEKNKFIKNTVGLYMEGTSRIQVKYNEFVENGWALKVQASCDNNNFETNNFIGNSFDVATNGTMMLNKFNRNYWDKYEGYDMDKNGTGDVPYYPVSVYSVITEKIPTAMILYRSFLTNVMDQVEKIMPSIIPDQLKDDEPRMKKLKL
jgi:nitrous oxidase accessory protein